MPADSSIALSTTIHSTTSSRDGERQRVVAGYNEDDCRATLARAERGGFDHRIFLEYVDQAR